MILLFLLFWATLWWFSCATHKGILVADAVHLRVVSVKFTSSVSLLIGNIQIFWMLATAISHGESVIGPEARWILEEPGIVNILDDRASKKSIGLTYHEGDSMIDLQRRASCVNVFDFGNRCT